MAPNAMNQSSNRPYPPRTSSFENHLDRAQQNEQEGRPQASAEEAYREGPNYSHGVVASHFLAQPQDAPGGETWMDFLANPTAPDLHSQPQSPSSRYALPNRPLPRTDSSSSRSSDRKRRLTSSDSPIRRPPSSIRMHSHNTGNSRSDPILVGSSPASVPTATSARPQVPPPNMRPSRRESDLVLPRWQPDAEVSQCPVCGKTFTFLHRKHHCRKCGRVVCASCSPHRITIPRQFIVHPPSYDLSHIIDLTGEDENTMAAFGPLRNPALGGGEEVRVCNPCVPDPNYNPPPQYLTAPSRSFPSARSSGPSPFPPGLPPHPRAHRSSSSVHDPSRSDSHGQPHALRDPFSDNRRVSYHASTIGERWLPPLPGANHTQPTHHHSSTSRYTTPNNGQLPFNMGPGSQSVINMFPRSGLTSFPPGSVPSQQQQPPRPRRQIAEEDECPICGNELPPKGPNDDETPRTEHIEECIALHSSSPKPVPLTQQTSASLPSQRTRGMSNAGEGASSSNRLSHAARGMFPFIATEKDCIDAEGNEEECIICFEEYEAGDRMARLVCWCKFHEVCHLSHFHSSQLPFNLFSYRKRISQKDFLTCCVTTEMHKRMVGHER